MPRQAGNAVRGGAHKTAQCANIFSRKVRARSDAIARLTRKSHLVRHAHHRPPFAGKRGHHIERRPVRKQIELLKDRADRTDA
jgi:hypothetical protein